MKYFVSADIHGFYKEWVTALNEKGFDINNPDHKIIVCGDLFDRGSQAKKLQAFIIELLIKGKIILIKGNHEDLAVELIDNYPKYAYNIEFTHHFHNGTFQTLLELTDMNYHEATSRLLEFTRRARNTDYFRRIIPYMKNYYETDNYIFVHAWIPVNLNALDFDWRQADEKSWERARWLKPLEMYKLGETLPNKTLVFGHWRCSDFWKYLDGKSVDCHEPYINKDIIALDGTTALSYKVNVVVIED